MEIGFIGCGNMAKAMISGILAEGTYTKDEIIAVSYTHLDVYKRQPYAE